jgi:hypothetical protein
MTVEYDNEPDEAIPVALSFDFPERQLWCEVLRLAVQAAMRGCGLTLYWLNDDSPEAMFPQLCRFLNLEPDRIRKAVADRNARVRPSHPNQHTKRREAIRDPGSQAPVAPAPASPVPAAALPAGAALTGWTARWPSELASAAPTQAVAAPRMPSDGWSSRYPAPILEPKPGSAWKLDSEFGWKLED